MVVDDCMLLLWVTNFDGQNLVAVHTIECRDVDSLVGGWGFAKISYVRAKLVRKDASYRAARASALLSIPPPSTRYYYKVRTPTG